MLPYSEELLDELDRVFPAMSVADPDILKMSRETLAERVGEARVLRYLKDRLERENHGPS